MSPVPLFQDFLRLSGREFFKETLGISGHREQPLLHLHTKQTGHTLAWFACAESSKRLFASELRRLQSFGSLAL